MGYLHWRVFRQYRGNLRYSWEDLRDFNQLPISDVTISDGKGHYVITDVNGNYTFSNLAPGDYTITPSRSGYNFSPAFRQVTINDKDVLGQDFTGSICSGEITSPVNNSTIGTESVIFSANAWTTNPIGIKDVVFFVYYDGIWHNVGIDNISPYTVEWQAPANLEPQQLRFAIDVTDNENNTDEYAGGAVIVNFIDALNNPQIIENWVPYRVYLNQRSLGVDGDSQCSVASMTMMMAMNGLISADYTTLKDKANEMYPFPHVLTKDGHATVENMQQELEQQGMVAVQKTYTIAEGWSMIKKEVDLGRPVIVRTQHGVVTTYGHFILAVGYKEAYGGHALIVYDPFGKWQGTTNLYNMNSKDPQSHKGQWVFLIILTQYLECLTPSITAYKSAMVH